MREVFGELRSLLAQPANEQTTWLALLRLLSVWSDPQEIEDMILPYTLDKLEAWDDHARVLPESWLEPIVSHVDRVLPQAVVARTLHIRNQSEHLTRYVRHEGFQALTRLTLDSRYTHVGFGFLTELTHRDVPCALTHLDVSWLRLPAGVLASLLHSASLPDLESLVLEGCGLTASSLVALADATQPLKHLVLSNNEFEEGSLYPLHRAAFRLESLALQDANLGGRDWSVVFDSKMTSSLKRLSLSSCEPTVEFGAQMAKLKNLNTLNMNFASVTDEVILSWSQRGTLDALKTAQFEFHSLTSRSLAHLFHAHDMALETLSLSYPQSMTTPLVSGIFNGKALKSLRHLELSRWTLSDQGWSVIFEEGQFSALTSLNLSGSPISKVGMAAMVASQTLDGLQVLDLRDARLDDEILGVLLSSVHLSSLVVLTLQDNDLTLDGLKAILCCPGFRDLQVCQVIGPFDMDDVWSCLGQMRDHPQYNPVFEHVYFGSRATR